MPGVSGSGGIEFLSSWFALRFAPRCESETEADQLPGCLTAYSMSVALVAVKNSGSTMSIGSQPVGTRVEAGPVAVRTTLCLAAAAKAEVR